MERNCNCLSEQEPLPNFEVIKFGGSSLKDAKSIRQCANVVSGGGYRVVIVSAPANTTDLLQGAAYEDVYRVYREIQTNLGMPNPDIVDRCLERLKQDFTAGAALDQILSWGEWSMAKIFANVLGANFIDAAEVIRVREEDKLIDPVSAEMLRTRILEAGGLCVLPGFYGANWVGERITFARGGSDYTGVFVSGALGSGFVKSTDQNGLLDWDGAVVSSGSFDDLRKFDPSAKLINRQALEHAEAFRIPIWIRNSRNPNASGSIVR